MEIWGGFDCELSSVGGTQLCFLSSQGLLGHTAMSSPCVILLPRSTGGKLRQAGGSRMLGPRSHHGAEGGMVIRFSAAQPIAKQGESTKSTALTRELPGHQPLGCFVYGGGSRKAMLMDGQTGGQADCCSPGCKAAPDLAMMALNSLC